MNVEELRTKIRVQIQEHIVASVLDRSTKTHGKFWRICSCAECELKRRYKTQFDNVTHLPTYARERRRAELREAYHQALRNQK